MYAVRKSNCYIMSLLEYSHVKSEKKHLKARSVGYIIKNQIKSLINILWKRLDEINEMSLGEESAHFFQVWPQRNF